MPGIHDLGRCLSYLQRADRPGGTPFLAYTQLSRPQCLHILGVGVDDKTAGPGATRSAPAGLDLDPGMRSGPSGAGRPAMPEAGPTLPSASLFAGLSAHRLPIVFTVSGDGHRVAFRFGVSPPDGTAGTGARLTALAASMWDSLYPQVRYANPNDRRPIYPQELTTTGLALGIPVAAPPVAADPTTAWDRILRALIGHAFEIIILAYPISPGDLEAMRSAVLTELRDVAAATKAENLPSPAADHYTQLLTTQLRYIGQALGSGGWRTAVYLCGNADSYAPLKGVWRGTFASDQGSVEPVRVYDSRDTAGWARNLAMPTVEPAPPPGTYVRPFEWQTMLTSAQLATYVHLPALEHLGFSVDLAPRFDVVRPPVQPARPIHIGDIRHGARTTGARYEIDIDDLTRHAFITGVTGAGKSHTMRYLLHQIAAHRPFLVIEPAKAEYRALLTLPELAGRLAVFTAANETVCPLRINPLYIEPGVPLGTHLDLLRSLFTASFALWSPLPQLLDRALHELYTERGFDIYQDTDRQPDTTQPADTFPTLDDLRRKVDAVISGLGYAGEVVSNMRAALMARLDGLCTGARGRMLDTLDNTPDELLFEYPAVIELENIGDEDDQAFLMGLLMIRLLERRRQQGPHQPLRHVLVVEEAHRLLSGDAKPAQPQAGTSGAREKAVSAFTNMLAELRSYGQGIIVADQIPTKLAPEVIKNTGLKIVHRLVAADDRQTMGAATVMTDQQSRAIATLDPGSAAVFGRYDDAPVLVQIPHQTEPHQLSNHDVTQRMTSRGLTHAQSGCQFRCTRTRPSCETAAETARARRPVASFGLLMQSLAVSSDAGRLAWPDVLASIEPHLPHTEPQRTQTQRCTLLRLATAWTTTRGPLTGWTHTHTTALTDSLIAAIHALHADENPDHLDELHTALADLAKREHDPFPLCHRICPDATCLFRHTTAHEVASGNHRTEWWEATSTDQRWTIATDVAASSCITTRAQALPGIEAMTHRAALCFAQQMFLDIPTYGITDAADATDRLLRHVSTEQEG